MCICEADFFIVAFNSWKDAGTECNYSGISGLS